MNDLYGNPHALQCDIFKRKSEQTCFMNNGVINPFYSKEIRDKAKQKCIDIWGVEFYSQSPEFHKKCHKRYTNPKYPDMTFGSSWEFKLYDFLVDNRIVFEYQPSISIPYEYDGKQHTYHPDFRIGDKIVEVKGDHFFRINESTGQEEMFNPYRDEDWSYERYDWECGKYEAKHQCMITNKVIILRECEIERLKVEWFL